MLSKTLFYVKSYEGQGKWMYFLIEDPQVHKIHYYPQVFLKECKYIEKKSS